MCTGVGAVFAPLLLVEHPAMTALLPAYLYFVVVGVPMAAIDATTGKLPDCLTLPSYPILVILLSVAEAASSNQGSMERAAAAAVVLVALFFVAAFMRGVGLGDVKLAGLLGLVLGFRSWTTVYAGMLVAFVLAAIFIVFSSARRGNYARIPLGPFLVAGAMVAILL
ncbi:prepilin peptidase [Catenulispora sp. GP43]|uniref:prepilin peptidase n=1 Tax=Catenulispora sp. GP43 TaxID=3156263 RepID=UPI003518D76A